MQNTVCLCRFLGFPRSIRSSMPVFCRNALDERSLFLQSTARSFFEIGNNADSVAKQARATAGDTIRDARILQAATASGLQLILNDDLTHGSSARLRRSASRPERHSPFDEARAIVGQVALIGLSTHSFAQVATANETTADYIAIGPVFSTTTKSDAEPVVGLARRARGALADSQAAGGDRRHYA